MNSVANDCPGRCAFVVGGCFHLLVREFRVFFAGDGLTVVVEVDFRVIRDNRFVSAPHHVM